MKVHALKPVLSTYKLEILTTDSATAGARHRIRKLLHKSPKWHFGENEARSGSDVWVCLESENSILLNNMHAHEI